MSDLSFVFLTRGGTFKPRPTYEVRYTDGDGWQYRIHYVDGRIGFPVGGFWSEEAARTAARRVCNGDTEWHR